MTESDWVGGFEKNRIRLRAVAYRMLGSLAEAEDAVQEAWIRGAQSDNRGVENFDAWFTTIIVRVCLNVLRSRNSRPEEPMGVHVPDPIISRVDSTNPEDEVLLADSVGLALQVVLETLSPAERVALVLHDMFHLTFDEIAPMLGRTPSTTRQLASRARRRVRNAEVRTADPDITRQREVVDAFFVAAHRGDLNGLVAVLDPDVVVRIDGGVARRDASVVLHGAAAVVDGTIEIASSSAPKRPVLVNGAAGVVVTLGSQVIAVMGFTVSGGRIMEIDAVIDPERLGGFELALLNGWRP
jgi:RNA polymerase sigma factor (sigma-70 family)